MKKLYILLFIFCCTSGLWNSNLSSVARAQFVPIDVFLTYDSTNNTAQLYFANNLTGLSAETTISGYTTADVLLQEFRVAANGVVFAESSNGAPRLATPGGTVLDFDFIPQSEVPPLAIDWVLSEDGTTLAWAELSFANERWQAALFTARLDGTNLHELPTPPAPAQPTLRVRLLGVSNDANRVLLDIDHPIEARQRGQAFDTYTSLRLYSANNRIYAPLAENVNCPCPASVADDLQYLLLLERPIIGNGFNLYRWTLNSGTPRIVPANDTVFQQGGDVVYHVEDNLALYSLVGLEGGEQATGSAVTVVDFTSGNQRIIRGPVASNLRVQALLGRDQGAIVVDLNTSTTFKLDLENNSLEAIAAKIWLGTILG